MQLALSVLTEATKIEKENSSFQLSPKASAKLLNDTQKKKKIVS